MSKHRRSKSKVIPSASAGGEAPSETPRRSWQTVVQQVWIVLMYAITLQLTWPLWGERTSPPLLPLVDWPPVPYFGTMLLVTAVCILFWPRAALAANVLVGLAAMTADQTRMQPEIFSLWLLLLGTMPNPVCKFLARCHLASLWFFSGLHKLLSPAYYTSVAPFLWEGILPTDDWPNAAHWAVPTAVLAAVVELSLGIAVWFPRVRRYTVPVIVLLHCSAVTILHRLDDWNTAVYPWNLALAVVGAWFIYDWRSSPREERASCGTVGFAAGIALFLSPLLFYVGLLDAYLSHCLYSANVPAAVMIPAAAGSHTYHVNGTEGPYWSSVNVPQPPAHRIFEAYFRRTAGPGDRLEVVDPRLWAVWTGWDRYRWQHTGATFERIRLSSDDRGR
jgi:hypothetical protein